MHTDRKENKKTNTRRENYLAEFFCASGEPTALKRSVYNCLPEVLHFRGIL